MGTTGRCAGLFFFAVILAVLQVPAGAATVPEYTMAYTISVQNDGTALWQVEYRTLLATDGDTAAFEEYAGAIDAVYLPQIRDLMERSVSQATIATSRHMDVTDFTGTADIQTSPTGRYGVVLYSFTWDGFAKSGTDLEIGDAFAGGMYLPKDASLTIRYPSGYRVASVTPAPDIERDGLTWYGLRSFGTGEPRIVLEQDAFPILPVAAALVLLVLVAFAGFFLYHRKKRAGENGGQDPAPAPLSQAEIVNLEERILQLLGNNGNEMFQSEIVKTLGLPKSTVSSALNDLHARGSIVKVKKGRENLIRRA